MSSSGRIAERTTGDDRLMTLPDPECIFEALSGRRGLLLAVSGGRDSTALMILAAQWLRRNRPQCALKVATVDHGLRPEAEAETRLVADNARTLGLDCLILRTTIGADPGGPDDGGNVQARARDARYKCLAEAARDNGLDTIVTAHHRDDQAETFLLRLARGSGVYGLGAMRDLSPLPDGTDDDIAIARPLLDISRSDLHSLVEQSGLAWVDDPTNDDPAYARVRVRQAAPALAKAGLTTDGLAATAARMQRAGAALDHYAGDHLKASVTIDDFGAAAVDIALFLDAPEEVVLRALGRLLQAVGGSAYTPRMDRLEGLLSALSDAVETSTPMRRTLNGCVVDFRDGDLRFWREWGRSGLAERTVEPGTVVIWDRRFRVTIPQDLPAGVVLAPLGAERVMFRGVARAAILQAVPALFRDGDLVALPGIPGGGGPGDLARIDCRSMVADRLFNP